MRFTLFCVYLLTVAGWTQNRGLNIDGSAKGCRFDSHCPLFIIWFRLADGLVLQLSLGFEPHLELALENTQTHNFRDKRRVNVKMLKCAAEITVYSVFLFVYSP